MLRSQILEVAVEELEHERVIRARGEIDMSSIKPLRLALADARGELVETVVDLSGVDFIDSTGLHLMLDASFEAAANGWNVSFVPSMPVFRLLEVTGTLGVVPLDEAEPRAQPERFA
jgi:anti-sigma B factor antagonist